MSVGPVKVLCDVGAVAAVRAVAYADGVRCDPRRALGTFDDPTRFLVGWYTVRSTLDVLLAGFVPDGHVDGRVELVDVACFTCVELIVGEPDEPLRRNGPQLLRALLSVGGPAEMLAIRPIGEAAADVVAMVGDLGVLRPVQTRLGFRLALTLLADADRIVDRGAGGPSGR